MKRKVIDPEASYTFSDYFKLRASTEDVVTYFGYSKENARIEFPKTERDLAFIEDLKNDVEDVLLHISLENEITRREFLIAPIMLEVRRATQSKLNSEYWFEHNHQLKGSLDYLLKNSHNLLVVEAKNADLSRGFTQLAVEMIALDKAEESENELIYGAVTTGQEWIFSKLNRNQKLISQSIDLLVVSQNLEDIVRILIGILEDE